MSETKHTFRDFVFPWTRGRTLPLDLTVTNTVTRIIDGEITKVTTAEDLTVGEVWVTGKLSLADDDADALFRLNVANGGVQVQGEAAGKALATIARAKTQDLPDCPTPVYVDCVRVTSDGECYSFQQGTITFRPSGEKTLT